MLLAACSIPVQVTQLRAAANLSRGACVEAILVKLVCLLTVCVFVQQARQGICQCMW